MVTTSNQVFCPVFFSFMSTTMRFLAIAIWVALALTEPVVVPPSTNWDGNDGPWSTFTLRIGTPPQDVRVLPSSSGSTLWAVLPEGCENDRSDCPSLRGGLFSPNESSTWEQKGLYSLPMGTEKIWGYTGSGDYGYDQIQLSYSGGGGPTLNDQILAGIATKDFFIGTLGLTPWGVNFTDFNNPIPSILTSLRNGTIESRSWAYTAGARWTEKETFGSLIFGGYDRSRFTPNDLVFTRAEDISRDLLVGVQQITSGTNGLLPTGIIAMIDSTLGQMWLPAEACARFEQVFGLVWDDTVNLYLVNDTLHDRLLADNPSVTFVLGNTTTSGQVININMPYGAFDLFADWPLSANGSTRYFPLRRAENSTQYALGRPFLQAAYLMVDYDRNTFTVSQALYPDSSQPREVVTITAPSTSSSSSLGIGAIIGIVIGIVVVLLVAAIWWWLRRRRSKKTDSENKLLPQEPVYSDEKPDVPETDPATTPADTIIKGGFTPVVEAKGNTRFPVEAGGQGRAELATEAGTNQPSELASNSNGRLELGGSEPYGRSELGSSEHHGRSELGTDSYQRSELGSPGYGRSELGTDSYTGSGLSPLTPRSPLRPQGPIYELQ